MKQLRYSRNWFRQTRRSVISKQLFFMRIAILILMPMIGWGQGIPGTESNIYQHDSTAYRRLTLDTSAMRINQFNIMVGRELAAYRKHDSAWVFLNPGGAIVTLEKYIQHYGWVNVDTSLHADTVHFGYGIQPKEYSAGDTINIDTAQLLNDGWQLPKQITTDTIPVTIDVQYSSRDIPMIRDCYLINGVPYYKAKGKWVRVRAYRWRISQGWNTIKNK